MSALEALYQSQNSVSLAQAVPPSGPAPNEGDVKLLARLIFAEGADHHDTEGAMEGLGWAVVNRVGAPGFPKTLDGVIHQPGQFHATRNALWAAAADPTSLRGPNKTAYEKARTVAEGVLNRTISDPTKGAQFFFSSRDGKVPGDWFPKKIDDNELEYTPDQKPTGRFYFLRPPPRR
jgi:spore germination cell wall hydrolase CwlJ-like protein